MIGAAMGALFEHMLDGVAHGRILYDAGEPVDFVYLSANHAFGELTGVREVVGKLRSETSESLLEQDPLVFAALARVARTRRAERLESFAQPAGRVLALTICSPAQGEFVMIIDDVTEQKRALAALRESEEVRLEADRTSRELGTLFRISYAAILVTRLSDNRILDVNDAFVSLFGFSREECIHSTTAELGIFIDRGIRDDVIADIRTKGYARPRDLRARTRDGHELVLLISGGVTERGGEQCGLGVLRDVTSERGADRALRESEERFRSVFEDSTVGMALTEPGTHRLIHANDALCAMLGYSRDELLRLGWAGVSHPGDSAVIPALLTNLHEGRSRAHTSEKRYLRKDGETIWGRVTISVVSGANGGVDSHVGIIEDITAQRAAEQMQQRQTSALEAAADGIVITNASGSIEWVNEAVERLTGFTRAELMGAAVVRLGAGDGANATSREILEAVSSKKVWRGRVAAARKDGSTYPEELSVTPVIGADGLVTHAVAVKRDVSERERADRALFEASERLRASEERYRLLVDNLDVVIFSVDTTGTVTFVNRAISQFGFQPEQVVGKRCEVFAHRDDLAWLKQQVAEGGVAGRSLEWRLVDANGKTRFVRCTMRHLQAGDQVVGMTGVMVDQTLQHETEEELRAAQKMEAVGRLAGGVAHDFNNLLTVILSYTESALEQLHAEDPLHAELKEVADAGYRAAALTRQLLAFSRRQVLEPEPLDVNELVGGLARMLRRVIGEDIDLSIRPGARSAMVKADRGQLEQVLMNLLVNARDAMPDGGSVAISTADVELDPAAAASRAEPGAYVELRVSDTGCGMDAATRARIFEPFFTTKEVGKGTGLGLSTVYGIIKQSHGSIDVESEPGQGTTFRVLLPRYDGDEISAAAPASIRPRKAGHETILVVEDEAALRSVVGRMLSSAGYRVLTAENAEEAARVLEHEADAVDLVLTDVVMPGAGGHALAEQIAARHAGSRVLFMSGYHDAIERHDVTGANFLRKPFDRKTLTQKVRCVLDEAPA